MKKILNALFVASLAVFTFSSCSDVPAPYEIIDSNNQSGNGGTADSSNPLGLNTAVSPLTDFSNNFDDVENQKDYVKEGWINKALQEKRIWQGSVFNQDKYLSASTYDVDNGKTAEYWFVTPYFTVAADKNFTFSATCNKYEETMSLKVFFLQLKDGKMISTEIPVANMPADAAIKYTWTKNLKVDLTQFTGQNGFVGFQYVAKRLQAVQTYAIDDIYYGAPQVVPQYETIAVTKETAYSETFKYDLGKFSIEDKEIGKPIVVWSHDSKYDCALAYAVEKGGADGKQEIAVPAESWLVSPVIDLASIQSTDDIALTFTQKSAGQGKAEEYMLKIKDVSTKGEWQPVTLNMPQGSYKATFSDISLKEYAGKKIQIAFVYKNTLSEGKPCKWQIQAFKVGVKVPLPGGTKEDPLTCAEAIQFNSTASGTPYVKGFIVGYHDKQCHFDVAGATKYNVLIADMANETDPQKCICVQLPSSGDFRTKVALDTNPDNLGKQILFSGSLSEYNKMSGLKNTKTYEWVK